MSVNARLSPLPTIKEILKLYQIKALKKLSQNFLINQSLTSKIVNAAGNISDGQVCEVGPGPGAITRSILLKGPKKLIVIEKDKRFQPMLEQLADVWDTDFVTIYSDIRNFDLSNVFNNSYKTDWNSLPPNIHLIGNLPFSVSTPLIIQWMRDISLRRNAWSLGRVKMTLTFQEEVAERIVSQPFAKNRCRMSVMCQNWCNVTHKFTIPGRAFLPKPDVNVGIVHFEPLKEPIIPLPFDLIEKVLRTLFLSKQKYIKTTVKNLFPKTVTEDLSKELLNLADVQCTKRSIQLTIEEWRRLCFAYFDICSRDSRLYSYNFRGSRSSREYDWMKEDEDVDQKCTVEGTRTI